MKFLFLTLLVCFAIFMAVSAVPVDESIPEGLEGAASDRISPTDDQSFLLKLALLKKLLFLG
ncbi:uncharacterized protein LOC119673349 [Teleopsis dalmanni]|uniref:uncharacterized protein LOC119673348 n=1 Tax=Teleopsis dalmanni TaxID=139649 RepID=UPI0018CF7B84|nr:uncharacterized protein LOC119673348 [Teleopsis dalmanni]XP_037940541.1 uncharacterized protein LOC119673349 [Teleopsis dalmanni]